MDSALQLMGDGVIDAAAWVHDGTNVRMMMHAMMHEIIRRGKVRGGIVWLYLWYH